MPKNDLANDKQKADPAVLHFIKPALRTSLLQQELNGTITAYPKKIDAGYK